MRAPLFLAACLFSDNPFLRELTGQTMTGGGDQRTVPYLLSQGSWLGFRPSALNPCPLPGVCRPLTMAPMTIMDQWRLGPLAFGHLVLSSHPKTFKIRHSVEMLGSWYVTVSFCLSLTLRIPTSLISPGNNYSATCLPPLDVCLTPKKYPPSPPLFFFFRNSLPGTICLKSKQLF